ncbi:ArsR/SmtB family transcription factor [Propionibacteriaceae bacterium G57]|uniref:ArsR/SmtB family transcription factor n=1 Tax=Aestuariimicrobium sp. G57 TaxID=3418485 RepID=UPI003DA787A7
MSHDEAAALATLLKAMADPTRVRLLHHLSGVPGGTACACHLPGELGISQPTLSHHLKTLVEADLLTRQQQGRWAHYTVRAEALAPLTGLIASLAQEP